MGGDAKVTADGVVATDLTAVKHATQEEARELFVIEPISITVSGPSGRTVPETWQTHGRAVYRLTQTVLIKACLNGGRTRGEHPSVPVTAEEIAADARRVAEAGAGAVHVHPRDVRGKETLDPAPCGDAVASIRGLAPDLPIGLTTAAWIAPHPDRLRLIERWDPPPDFASVNVSEEGTADLCRVLADRGIQPEGGLVEAEEVARLEDLPDARWLRLLIEIDEEEDGARAVARAEAVERTLDEAGIDVPRLHHGSGRATWDVIRAAIAGGRDVRVGLEDTTTLPDGSLARDNAHLVAAVADMAGKGVR